MSEQVTHPQFKRTITSLEYERDRFASINDDGTLDYYRIKVVEKGPQIIFELAPPVLTDGFVFLKKKVYRLTKADLIKGKFLAASRLTTIPKEQPPEVQAVEAQEEAEITNMVDIMWKTVEYKE